jgi:protein-L-isoaspartate(D-aspartate) O-methyltransferase
MFKKSIIIQNFYLLLTFILVQNLSASDKAELIQQDTSERWKPPVFTERMNERNRMVNEISNHFYIPVKDKRVLAALRNAPRHEFVPENLQMKAYANSPLPIGYGQTISQPLIVGHMTELLEIEPGDRILEIGTGSGYQAAVLAELTPHVYTIEIIPELANRASETLKQLGYSNIKTKLGDGYGGWKEYAPFDGIIVTCAPEDIPRPLIEQLKPGGVIVIPVGEKGQTQMLVVVRKGKHGGLFEEKQFPVRFVPMTGTADEDKD